MTHTRVGLIVIGGLTATALAGLLWAATHDATTPIGVVVITLDTTRADRLSPYGFMNVSLPSLERLAREGVLFDQATTVAPLTLPAHTSLFTGLLPPNHGVRDNSDAPLANTQTTLAEILRGRGFRTGAFVGSVVLDRDRGLQQGFEQYRGVDGAGGGGPETRQRRADAVMNDAIGWLDTIGEAPFLLWTHLYDAHRPYDPPEPYRSIYGHNLYVGEIAFADSQVGRLLDALDARHLLDRTVVVVTADHGEALGDHGERDHGIFVYDDVLRVPLIIRAPGLRPSRIGEVVRLTDILPTVLGLLRVPSPDVDGVNLADLMTGRRHDLNLQAYSESLYPQRFGWSPLRALRDGRYKLIEAPRPELYDIEEDPFEQRNIFEGRRALAQEMTARLAMVAKGRGSAPTPDERSHVTPELQARLGALGYLASAVVREPTGHTPLPDPKDCIGSFVGETDVLPLRSSGSLCRPAGPYRRLR